MSPTDRTDLQAFFVDAFWIALRTNNVSKGAFSSIYPGLERGNLGFIDAALDCLEECAAGLATGQKPWRFSTPFLAAAEVPTIPFSGRNEASWAHYLGFRKALTAIALNVHLAGLPDKNAPGITADEFFTVRNSVHWADEVWINENAENRIRYLSAQAAKDLLDDMTKELGGKISEFNERADQWTKYSTLSHLYGEGDPRALMQRASSCLTSHKRD